MRRARLNASALRTRLSSIATFGEAAILSGRSGNLGWRWVWIRTVQSALLGNFARHTKAWWRMRVRQLVKPKRTCACRSVSIWNLLRMHSRRGGRCWNYSGRGKTLVCLYNRVPNLRMHTPKILFHMKHNLIKLIIRPAAKTFPRLLS